jgi:hypothetical protein
MYNNSGQLFGYFVIGLIVIVGIFLICRELICWYWKINKMVKLMEAQNEYLNKLLVHFGVSEVSVEEKKSIDEQIQEIENDQKVEQNELKIKRVENVVGSALLVNVDIDNQTRFSLENGEEKTVKIQNGNHTILATFDNGYDKKEFEIINTGKIFMINIGPPIKINEV